MALWNVPWKLAPNHESLACETALACVIKLHEMCNSHQWKQLNLPPFYIRIGINSGIAHVGNCGSPTRFSYTAIGDAVNIASRLQTLNKEFNTVILLSGQTYKVAKQDFVCDFVGFQTLRGRTQKVEAYSLVSNVNAASDLQKQCAQLLEQVSSLISQPVVDYQTAIRILQQVLEIKQNQNWNTTYVQKLIQNLQDSMFTGQHLASIS